MTPDTETPVEQGQRSAVFDGSTDRPLASAVGGLMAMAADAARAVELGELQREEAPAIPRPVVIPSDYQPPYVPREYRAAVFDTFNPDIAGPQHAAELTLALRAVKKWTTAAKLGRRAMLALVGSQGNGKSTLLYAAVNLLAMNHVRVFSRPWYRLADELRYGGPSPWMVDGPVLEAHDLRRTMYRAPVVVIDEVRATAGTSFDDTELAKFACHAWDEGLAVLITTNINPLAAVMGDAAADRFTVITLTAPSRRQDA